jgi:hypothetical protein
VEKMNKEQVKELAEINATYTFVRAAKQYGEFTDEYVRHFYNKLAELRGGIDDNHTCNCQHNSDLRDNEPCRRCDSKQTNADRIRNMSDEELLDFICSIETYEEGSVKTIRNGIAMCSVTEIEKWLQSEAE